MRGTGMSLLTSLSMILYTRSSLHQHRHQLNAVGSGRVLPAGGRSVYRGRPARART